MREFNLIDKYIQRNPKTKSWEPIPWQQEVFPYWLYFDSQYVEGPFAINAVGVPTPAVQYKLQHASLDLDNGVGNPLLINETTFCSLSADGVTETTANADFSVMLKDMGDKTQFMNQPIHIRTFSAPSVTPARFSEPIFLPSRHTLQAFFTKLSGPLVNMRMFLIGKSFMPWAISLLQYPQDKQKMMALINKYLQRRKYVYPFFLTTESQVVIPANGAVEVDALIGDDGHFEASHLMSISTGDYVVDILNPDTRQSLMNGKVDAFAIIGNAQYPTEAPVPWVFEAGSRIRFRFEDVSGATNTVYPTFRGRKIRAPLKDWAQIKKDLALPENAVEPEVMGG